MALPSRCYNRSTQAVGCWKPSEWQNINIVWQHIRRNISVPPCATKLICNIGTPWPVPNYYKLPPTIEIPSLAKTIRERVEAGLVDPQDLLMAEVKLNEAEYQLLQAKSNLETGRMALNSLIGMELNKTTEVEDSIPSIVMNEELWNLDGCNRPELKIAYDQINIAKSSKKLTDSKYKPQLYVGIEGSYSSPGYNFKSDLDPNYAVYAKLSVPIFEWGKRRNEKQASSFQVGAATDNLHQVSDHVNLEVQTARVSLSQAMEQVQLTGNSLDKARENERMALERYAEGKVSVVEVIEAQNYRQVSQTNYVQAKVSAQGHYSALLKALNRY